MREAFLISFIVAARLFAQESPADSPVADSGETREPVLEAREVVGDATGDPGGGILLSRDDLATAASLAQALGREPGVLVRSSGGLGSYTTLSLRGSPSEQVEVYLDGIPLGGSNGSTVDLGPFSLDGLERAEIFQAGDGGSGASPRLDLVSRRGWARWGGSAGIGSFGERSASGWWGDGDGRLAVTTWWETSRNDYPFPWNDGTTTNTSDDAIRTLSNDDFTGEGAAVGWRPSESVEGSLRWDASDQGLSSPLETNPLGRLDRRSLQMDLRDVDSGTWVDRFEGSWRRGWSDWRDPTQSSGYQADIASDETADDLGATWSLARRSGGWFDPKTTASLRWERSERNSVGEEGLPETPNGNRASGSFGIGWTGRNADRFGADLEGRTDLVRDERDYSTTFDGTRPVADTSIWRFAWRGQARTWTRRGAMSFWISGSARERLPDFSEWMGDNGSGLPNLSLKPEKSGTAEIGSEFDRGSIHASVSGWDAVYDDPIESVEAGASPLFVHQNGPGYEAAGLDGRVSCSLWRLAGFAGGTLQKARIDDPNPALDGNEPRRTPQWKGSASAKADLGWGGELGYSLDAQGPTWATELNTGADRRPGRILHGIWIRWRHGPVSIFLAARNLTDVHTEDIEDLPLSGRQFQARLDIDFQRRPPESANTVSLPDPNSNQPSIQENLE